MASSLYPPHYCIPYLQTQLTELEDSVYQAYRVSSQSLQTQLTKLTDSVYQAYRLRSQSLETQLTELTDLAH